MKDNKSMAEFQKIMGTTEGKRLLAILTKDGAAAMQSAGKALQQGDETAAKEKMAPLLENREVQSLLQRLNQTMGHG